MLPLATHQAICLRAPLHPRQASAILRHAKPPMASGRSPHSASLGAQAAGWRVLM